MNNYVSSYDGQCDLLYSYDTNRLFRRFLNNNLFMSNGRITRKVHYVPSQGFGAHAYIRILPWKKIECWASGRNVLENLAKRLEDEGWYEC